MFYTAMVSLKTLLRIKREIILNKSSNITCFVGLPNTKKTFFSILFSYRDPVVYADFGYKNITNLKEEFKKFNLGVWQVPPDRLNNIESVIESLAKTDRGTIVLDSFGMLPLVDQGDIAEIILNSGKSISFNLVLNAFNFKEDRKNYGLSITLPSILAPLDKRLIDLVFVSDKHLRMLGRTEVKWSI